MVGRALKAGLTQDRHPTDWVQTTAAAFGLACALIGGRRGCPSFGVTHFYRNELPR